MSLPEALRVDFAHYSRSFGRTSELSEWALPKDDKGALNWLPTLTCVALGGTPQQAQAAQAAWALLYDASGVIDQVQDGHVDATMTNARALSAGVSLIFAGTEQLGRLPQAWQAEAYTYLYEMLSGQAEDVIKEHPTSQEALEITEKKAGAFMALGCALGARCAGAEEPVVAALGQYGRALGAMIQIHDDLDLIESLGRAQAQTPERFSNVALAYACQILEASQRAELQVWLEDYWKTGEPKSAQAAYEALVKSGARLYCVIEAGKRWDQARKAIDAVRFVSAAEHKVLLELVDGIVNAFKAPP